MVTITLHADRRDGHGVVCTAGARAADNYLRGSGHLALKAAGVEIVFYVEDLATVERLGLDIVEAAQAAKIKNAVVEPSPPRAALDPITRAYVEQTARGEG